MIGAKLRLECRIVREISAGDHVIALLGIARLSRPSVVPPVVFHASAFRSLADS
ncbi:hypothetical protein [Streptomyces sp. NPDC017993]|uniref:hypothetical protein n=1 Tax=Streptomyces sp. NPDC017993 TaxID=3365027 RepID=UPI0037931967